MPYPNLRHILRGKPFFIYYFANLIITIHKASFANVTANEKAD